MIANITNYRSKQKKCWHTINIKMEKNNELKEVVVKNRMLLF